MIENMRKYTGLMVVVLILLAAGLILTMGNFNANSGSRGKVTEVYGQGIDQVQYRKMGRNSINVIKQLGNLELATYAMDLIYNRQLPPYAAYGFFRTGASPQEIHNFVTKRLVILKAAADYGIHPSSELAKKHIKENIFIKDKQFDPNAYQEFLKNMGSSGMQEQEFVSLIAESLVYNKLKTIVTGGLQAPNSLTDRYIKFQQQTLDITTVAIDIEKYKKDITPTEEDINAYWKENDFKYPTDRTIRISYIIEQPTYSSPKPTLAIRTPEMKDDEYAKLKETHQKDLATWELEVQKPADTITVKLIDDISTIIDESDGNKFEEEITKAKLKLTKTDLFSQKNIPDELKELKTKNGQSIADIIFQTKFSEALKYRIPAPIKLKGNGWFYARYDEEVKPITKTYQQAKELAKADFIQEKAHAAMLKDVESIKETLNKSIAGGSTVTEAAKINNLKSEKRTALTYRNLKQSERGGVTETDAQIFENATITDNKSFSIKNVEEPNQATLVYLHKREVKDTTETTETRLREQQRSSVSLQDAIFRSWMDKANADANIPKMSFN